MKTIPKQYAPLGLSDDQLDVLDRALNAAEDILMEFPIGKSGIAWLERTRGKRSLAEFVSEAFERHVGMHLGVEMLNIAKHGHRNDDPEDDPEEIR
jgi:hypothetical protein